MSIERDVHAEYEASAADYDRRWAGYVDRSLALLRRPLAQRCRGTVVDVGCGTGGLAPRLERWMVTVARYVGVDVSAAMLRAAREKGEGVRLPAAWAAGSAAALPLPDGAAETVVSASSLHYWDDPAAGLKEVRRVLADGGTLVLLDWCGDFWSVRGMEAWLRLTRRPLGRVHGERALRAALEEAGFRVEEVRKEKISPVWGLMTAVARAA